VSVFSRSSGSRHRRAAAGCLFRALLFAGCRAAHEKTAKGSKQRENPRKKRPLHKYSGAQNCRVRTLSNKKPSGAYVSRREKIPQRKSVSQEK